MARYRDDPRWITTRYPGECATCRRKIKKGERAFYHPKGRKMACESCGEQQSAEFEAAASDENNNTCL